MDTTTEEYFQQVLQNVKEFEPWDEAELKEIEKEYGITFPPQLRSLFLRANDMVGWETSRFSLLTNGDLNEIFSGEDVDCGEEFKEDDYVDLGLFPFGTIAVADFSKYIFLDTEGSISDVEGGVIWQDRSDSIDPNFLLLENNLAEFLDGILKGVNYHERILEHIDEVSDETDED